MNSILVTGGAGFIGANFVRRCSTESGYRIVVLDALTYAGNLANLTDLIDEDRIAFHRGDICDAELVNRLFAEHAFDRVIHFAAETHVDRSILGPEEFLRTNVQGTYVLLEAARTAWQNQLDSTLFLHVSTDEVYGSLGPSDAPFDELSPYRPNSPYSASKAAADHLVRAWHHTFGLRTVISNCSNNYGPMQFPEKLIPLFVLNALESRELPVYGDGLQVRDWLHVHDHCEALLLLLAKGRAGETYVVGGNNERTNMEIIHTVCDVVDAQRGSAAGSARKLIRHVKDRPGHDRRYAINANKIRSELGWAPAHEFDDGIRETVQWLSANREWSEAIRSGEYLEYYEQQYKNR